MHDAAETYLDFYLGPLREQLSRPDVTDLYVNRAGELWVETLGGAAERIAVPDVTEAQLWRLARQVASVTHQGISREHPLLAARLPDGARIQIVSPPATRDGLIMAVRRHVSSDLALADYAAQGAFTSTRPAGERDSGEVLLRRLYDRNDWLAFLSEAVRQRLTILVSGGTSTGKTTFLNALLREIQEDERLVLIEDTPELVVRHANTVGLVAVRGSLGEASVTTDDLLMASLRLRPDRIILGELRGAEAFTFLRAINTGHPGSMSTIHADSPEGALDQLVLLASGGAQTVRHEHLMTYAGNVVDVIVQLERQAGVRKVASIKWTAAA